MSFIENKRIFSGQNLIKEIQGDYEVYYTDLSACVHGMWWKKTVAGSLRNEWNSRVLVLLVLRK